MYLTQEHVGKVLCLYQTGERIRIRSVDPSYVQFDREYGSCYAAHAHVADAFIEPDAERCALFERNYTLGSVLVNAELKAQRIIHGAESPLDTPESGEHMLGVIHAQQKHLMETIDYHNAKELPHPELVSAFFDQLYEMGHGRRDTFFGHKVENISRNSAAFRIDGRAMDYEMAMDHLCGQTPQSVVRRSLDDVIKTADSRRQKNPFTIEPKAITDHEL